MARDQRLPATNRDCTICGTRDEHGEVMVYTESLDGDGEWSSGSAFDAYPLCGPDWDWVVELARTVGDGTAAGLGVPAREPATASEAAGCDHCMARLGDEATALDVVPARRAVMLGHGRRLDTWHYRLCRQCATWWRTTLFDSSAVRSESERKLEGASGGWLSATSMDVAAVAPGSRDGAILRTVAEAEGRRFIRLRSNELPRMLELPNAAVFVSASTGGRAAKVARALPSGMRARCIVVSRGDAVEDVSEALRAGVADMLASPISPQQIAGAIDRLNAPPPSSGRDDATGLPILAEAFAINGEPGHLLRISPPPGQDTMAAALLLRRFLRGYDVVGCDGKGELVVVVGCSPEHLETVSARITLVLGSETRVQCDGSSVEGNGVAA